MGILSSYLTVKEFMGGVPFPNLYSLLLEENW
jgi:hypothetical protein